MRGTPLKPKPKKQYTDHDKLFKELIRSFFFEFLELFFPELNQHLDKEYLEFLEQEVFTDISTGKKYVIDLLAKVRFRGEGAVFLIHGENQNKWESPFLQRMFFYFAWLTFKHLLPIYPVVVFSFKNPLGKKPNVFEVKFPDFTPLRFEYRAVQLNRLNWRDFLRHQNPVACALMSKMKIAKEDRPKVKLECLRMLVTLKLTPGKQEQLSGFIDTYLRLDKAEEQVFEQAWEQIAPQERETTMEIITSWMERGIEQGEQREAEKLVLLLLNHKFGSLPELMEGRVRSLELTQQEDLAKALLGFQQLADAEKWLAENH